MMKDGVLLSESSGVGTVTFWWDGIALPNGFHVYNSPLPFDRNDPSHPEFVAGHYINGNDPFTWYDVVAETPEPATWVMLATGLAGGLGALRRKRIGAK
jgi:PEP-CTERM motif